MRDILLRSFQSPGDVVMLTAAVRDLHMNHPGEFRTAVETTAMQLWENNPYITKKGGTEETVQCEYPLIHSSNQLPRHFVEGYTDFLSSRLGVPIKPTAFKGDIHLSNAERSWISQVREIIGDDAPYWIIVAGGKFDFTIKHWVHDRWQQVVNKLRDRILFVQIGEKGHLHPPLHGVIDLRGKTDVRQLVRLVHHSAGVICPVTFAMHLAAAVPVKWPMPKNRPCVVVAGGREPVNWEAYPHHRFLAMNGALPCCDNGGCWKSRSTPLGDGDEKDRCLCENLVGEIPRCMDMISADDVSRAVELYFQGGVCHAIDGHKYDRFLTK